jgi:hypothetical protein
MALKDLQTGSRRIFQVESICCTLLRAHCRDGQSWSKQSCRHGVAATSNGTTNNGLLGIGIVETKKKTQISSCLVLFDRLQKTDTTGKAAQ